MKYIIENMIKIRSFLSNLSIHFLLISKDDDVLINHHSVTTIPNCFCHTILALRGKYNQRSILSGDNRGITLKF